MYDSPFEWLPRVRVFTNYSGQYFASHSHYRVTHHNKLASLIGTKVNKHNATTPQQNFFLRHAESQ